MRQEKKLAYACSCKIVIQAILARKFWTREQIVILCGSSPQEAFELNEYYCMRIPKSSAMRR
jgi:hypothetical protein